MHVCSTTGALQRTIFWLYGILCGLGGVRFEAGELKLAGDEEEHGAQVAKRE